jgi:hypothetical protein
MSIEQTLERIATALEIIAGSKNNVTVTMASPTTTTVEALVLNTTATPPAKKAKKTEKPEEVKAVTKEMLAESLHQVVLTKTPVKAKEILAKFNAVQLSEIKEEDYAECHATLEAALKNG